MLAATQITQTLFRSFEVAMTDGKQIKIGATVYAEQTHSRTVITGNTLTDGALIVGAATLDLKPLVNNSYGMLYVSQDTNTETRVLAATANAMLLSRTGLTPGAFVAK